MDLNWLYFIPVLLVMVLIHEAGHFFTARLFGVKVLEFGVGFPPKAWSRVSKKTGIEYSVNWLPIGGFVRMDGENGDSDDPNSFGHKPTWQRAIILAAGPFMNIVLAFLVYIILSSGGKDMPKGQPGIISVAPASPAAAAGLQPGDVILSINGDSVQSTSDVSVDTTLNRTSNLSLLIERNNQTQTIEVRPRSVDQTPQGQGAIGISLGYVVPTNQNPIVIDSDAQNAFGKNVTGPDGKPLLQKGDVVISADGKTFTTNADFYNYIKSVNEDNINLVISRKVNGQATTLNVAVPLQLYINTVYTGSSADKAGLQSGSAVLQLDNTAVHTVTEYQNYMTAHTGQQVALTFVTPKGQQQSININAHYPQNPSDTVSNPNGDWSPDVVQASFAIQLPSTHVNFSPAGVVQNAWDQTTYAIALIPRTFLGLFNGSVSVKQLAGPVGMAQVTSMAVDNAGFQGLLTLLALLSVNLGVVNILPLPALDGGRLVFVLIEMVTRGRRVPPEKEGLVHLVGMVLLLGLMVVISWNDILRLITGGTFS